MSTSFQAKGDAQLSAQLKVQELNVVVTSAQANSASAVALPLVTLSGAAATRAVALQIGESVDSIISVSIKNQTTGAILPLLTAPAISTTTITTSFDASAVSAPVVICVKYVVVE